MSLYSINDKLESKRPFEELDRLSDESGFPITSDNFAAFMDERDPLSYLQEYFVYPAAERKNDNTIKDRCVYMCGNSLGLQPKSAFATVMQTYDKCMHDEFDAGFAEKHIIPTMAKIVGAKPEEISVVSGLTVNLHLLMFSFYQPTPERNKILIEGKAFPSDHYLAESQIRYHSFDPRQCLLTMMPRQGEHHLRTADILKLIEKEGDSIALVLFPGVQYYTGQLFDMSAIAESARKKGCTVGFDLAHAVGNVEISLHDWHVDFAAWCTYKYLNSGPGCLGGIFVHEKHASRKMVKLLGKGQQTFARSTSKEFAISPPCPLLLTNIKCSMEVFEKTSVKMLRMKSFYLTGYLEYLLKQLFPKKNSSDPPLVTSITPSSFNERGAQLSLVFSQPISEVHKEIMDHGVFCDVRSNVIRISPAPMYCRFKDVHTFVNVVHHVLEKAGIVSQ